MTFEARVAQQYLNINNSCEFIGETVILTAEGQEVISGTIVLIQDVDGKGFNIEKKYSVTISEIAD